MKTLSILLVALTLTACGTTGGALKYSTSPDNPPRAATTKQTVAVGSFADEREGDKKWLGVIRGGFGNHLKTLEADRPVSDMVHDAFVDGLKARQVSSAADGASRLSGRILTLYADQMVRREGNAEIELTVKDAAGNLRLKKTYKTSLSEGSALSMATGVLASVEDLRAVLEKTLSQVVDKALDDPEMRAALAI
jgi:uncharacterized lipoprotein YajG